jgi:putative DNA primase/helicase
VAVLETDESCLTAALGYAARGWRVFPCHWPVEDGCSCTDPACRQVGKHPLTTNGLKDATTDTALIQRWWSVNPNANVAIRTGAASGLWVLDADGAAGVEALARLQERTGQLPPTLVVETGGGGLHRYFAWPADGTPVRNATRVGGLPIDVRGEGGYVLAPPSRHASGRRYAEGLPC